MYIAVRVLCTSSYRSVWLTVGSIVYTKRKFPGKRRHSKARKFSPFSKSSHLPAFIVLFWVSKFQFVLVIYDIKSHFSFTDEALVHKYCNMTDVVLRVRCDKGRNWLKFIQESLAVSIANFWGLFSYCKYATKNIIKYLRTSWVSEFHVLGDLKLTILILCMIKTC